MLSATCHCGAVRIEVPQRPRTLTNCNCSICRRYGTLWGYYQARRVRVVAEAGATDSYLWGSKTRRFVRCRTCGCIVRWERAHEPERHVVGVNMRNFEPEALGDVRIRRLDGAKTWRHLRDDE